MTVSAEITATLALDSLLLPNEILSVTLTDGMGSSTGIGVQPFVWQFTGAVSPDSPGMLDLVFHPLDEDPFDSPEVELGDVDGDGFLDAVVATHEEVDWIYYGQGDGYFSDRVALSAEVTYNAGLALADLNGDGQLDIVREDQTYVLGANGVLPESPTHNQQFMHRSVLADLDGDGRLEGIKRGWEWSERSL